MRIKIIGDNNCARATRHLLRLAGFAVTEFLPDHAVTGGPLAGYAITIELAPATHTPDTRLRPDLPTQHHNASVHEEASHVQSPSHRDASSPALVPNGGTTAGEPAQASPKKGLSALISPQADKSAAAPAHFRNAGGIHFDSVDSALEAAVLRHVTQLTAAPVVVDRPGGVVHSDRELRIVAPNTGDAKADEAAAVAIEFGVLRGLLDLTSPVAHKKTWAAYSGKRLLHGDAVEETASARASADQPTFDQTSADKSAVAPANSRSEDGRKKWWPFGIVLIAALCGTGVSPAMWRSAGAVKIDGGAAGRVLEGATEIYRLPFGTTQGGEPSLLAASASFVEINRLKSVLLAASAARIAGSATKSHKLKLALLEAQEQMATGQGLRITDGVNFFVVDPCKGQTKLFASINQTGNTQLVSGTSSKKIYVCSIHVVAAAATNVAVVEGTGSVCGTGTAGVSGFGGATAATGWNFTANGGIALGNGDSSLGAEGTSGDNLCVFNSGSGQVSGGISYVVQ